MWDRLKAKADEFLASQVPEAIEVTLPDGKKVEAKSWRTTPYEIACGISKGLADNTVVAKVDGEVWDLDRPLEKSCSLQLLKFDDEDAQVGQWRCLARSSRHFVIWLKDNWSNNI